MKTAASFLETIRLENGKFKHLPYHQNRFDRTRQHFFMDAEPISLAKSLEVPPGLKRGLFKVRVLYQGDIESVSFHPYQIKPVKALKLVNADDVEYDFKYVDRSAINSLYAQKGACDDILLVKHGQVTDTSYANIILSDREYWYTPASPLMPGTCRARLLEEGKIIAADIHVKNLKDFQEIRLINAMMSFEEGPRISISHVS